MWCRHNWEVVSDSILESAFEQVAKSGQVKSVDLTIFNPCVFQKTHVLILKCNLCGGLKRYVTRSI